MPNRIDVSKFPLCATSFPMMSNNQADREDEKLFSGVVWLNSKVMGLVLGLLTGTFILLVTLFLSSDPNSKESFQLLQKIFFGYEISFSGSIVGFVYGFALGSLAGSLMGYVYNFFVRIRN